jgi:hypothetical protein
VDRIVLNAFFPLGHNPGGFRVWWRRWHDGSDEQLDNTHLMRIVGRFARRVKACGQANDVPVIWCNAGQRKHLIAEEHLAARPPSGRGVFLVLAGKAPARVWKVKRSSRGPGLGSCDDHDVRASAVCRAGHPQRPRASPSASSTCHQVSAVLG